jgi:hypothetical protein
MKTYTVELKRTSYITYTVVADDVEGAEDAAWLALSRDGSDSSHASWEIEHIEEEQS